MSTLIEVNEHLTVTLLKSENDIVLCQNVDNSEFVVWYKAYNGKGFCNGYYTLTLEDAIHEYNRRVSLAAWANS